jgi:CRP/FNR family transcriptional regulator, cyclic AMP receptor protein
MHDAELLAQISLFERLTPADCVALAAKLEVRSFEQGATVFAIGDIGSSLFLVRSGGVRIFLPGASGAADLTLKESNAGSYFGELSLFDNKPRSASVEALMPTVLLELTREVLVEHMRNVPEAALAILSEMSEHLRETNMLLSQRATKDVVKELDDNLSWGERLADKVAELNGSWKFIGFLLGCTALWSVVNSLMDHPFDTYPYVFFNLLLAVLVSLQGPLIVMSQNRQTQKDRAQAETDYRVNLKNEVGIETLRRELAAFRAETNQAMTTLQKRVAGADSVRSESVRPPPSPK